VFIIEGIDTAQGIEALGGDEPLYREVLSAFCDDIVMYRASILGYPNSTPLTSFITSVHGFKSAALNVGANDVGNLAAEIEKAAKSGDIAFANANFPVLVSQMSELLTRCSAALEL
jgi:HPt (histidine-containing phosphotransfer) domain-containing protein